MLTRQYIRSEKPMSQHCIKLFQRRAPTLYQHCAMLKIRRRVLLQR